MTTTTTTNAFSTMLAPLGLVAEYDAAAHGTVITRDGEPFALLRRSCVADIHETARHLMPALNAGEAVMTLECTAPGPRIFPSYHGDVLADEWIAKVDAWLSIAVAIAKNYARNTAVMNTGMANTEAPDLFSYLFEV
jgi:hypothetical protein